MPIWLPLITPRLLRPWTNETVNLKWFSVRGAFLRNRDPDPDKLQEALESGEPPPADIREKVKRYLDPERVRPPGNRPNWNDEAELRWIHLNLRCELVDRIRQDREIASRLNGGKKVSFRDACRWVECLPEQHLARLRVSPDLADYLTEANVKAAENSGKSTEQHYYTYHKPSRSVLKRVWTEMNRRIASGLNERDAAEALSVDGLYPDRGRSNRICLPPGLIRGHYQKAKRLFS